MLRFWTDLAVFPLELDLWETLRPPDPYETLWGHTNFMVRASRDDPNIERKLASNTVQKGVRSRNALARSQHTQPRRQRLLAHLRIEEGRSPGLTLPELGVDAQALLIRHL